MNGMNRASSPRCFAEAVCAGHPDRLADRIAARIVDLACGRDPEALVGVEVAVHRSAVFIDGRIAAGRDGACAVTEAEVVALAREAFREAGYGQPASVPWMIPWTPDPETLDVRLDLCLGPLHDDERGIRGVSDDQAICVGYACRGERAGWRPLEQALATDFAGALERLRVERGDLGLGPDGKVLVVVRARRLIGVTASVHHRLWSDWLELTAAVRRACELVAREYVAAGELKPLSDVDWLVNGAGAFEIVGPEGDNGLSGKKLVADAYGSSVPIGGGAVWGKDPQKVDRRGQARAREMALDLVRSGHADEATVWFAWRPGDVEPRWVEVATSRVPRRGRRQRWGASRSVLARAPC